MKPILFSVLLFSLFGVSNQLQAQNKLAVVDVKKVTDAYYKRKDLVDEINKRAKDESIALDNRRAVYQQMTSEMVKLDRTMNDLSISAKGREEARRKLVEQSAARDAKAAELSAATRKAENLISIEREKLEMILAADIQQAVVLVAKAKGYDLAFDKSYLPNSSYKSVLYASTKVTDLTKDVIARLNAAAPRGN